VGTDLRGPIRQGATDEELEAIVTRTWGSRVDRYSELRTSATPAKRKKIEMYHIGG
jgi:cyclic pyranopterin phosphate synthase